MHRDRDTFLYSASPLALPISPAGPPGNFASFVVRTGLSTAPLLRWKRRPRPSINFPSRAAIVCPHAETIVPSVLSRLSPPSRLYTFFSATGHANVPSWDDEEIWNPWRLASADMLTAMGSPD